MTRKVVFDDCYMCNWIMRSGDGDAWCGAGRPEFDDDHATKPCPTRLEKAELWYWNLHHPHIVTVRSVWSWEVDELSYVIDADVRAWMAQHTPDATFKVLEDPDFKECPVEVLFTFASPADAIHFKMRWHDVSSDG